jgi:hypothetical protein
VNGTQHAYVIFTKSRYDRLTFSDGTARLYPSGEGQQARDALNRAIRLPYEKWVAQQPGHWSASHRAEQWDLYRSEIDESTPIPVGQVQEVRGWLGYFNDATGSRQLTELVETSLGGIPATEITDSLDVLSRLGWQVESVTEDKGLYSGADAPREAGPVTVRILLRRSSS